MFRKSEVVTSSLPQKVGKKVEKKVGKKVEKKVGKKVEAKVETKNQAREKSSNARQKNWAREKIEREKKNQAWILHGTNRAPYSSVINLSRCSLSTDKISVLSRGLTFCPTPQHINWPQVSSCKFADNYDFSRRMRLAEYFFDENNDTSIANEHDTPLDR